MNMGLWFIAIMSIGALSSCVSAQDRPEVQKLPDFSGTWILDKARSKPDEHDRIESLTLVVKQSQTDVHVDSDVKLIPMDPAFLGGLITRPLEQNTSNTYRLDGKETEGQVPTGAGPQSATLKAQLIDVKLQLCQTRFGDPTVTFKETWSVSKDGKTLIVERVGPTGRASTLIFSKK